MPLITNPSGFVFRSSSLDCRERILRVSPGDYLWLQEIPIPASGEQKPPPQPGLGQYFLLLALVTKSRSMVAIGEFWLAIHSPFSCFPRQQMLHPLESNSH